MSKIKAVTRPKKNIRGEVPIFVRISDADRTRYMTTGLKIRPSFWNKRLGCVRKNDYYDYDAMNKIIETQIREARGEEYKLRADGKYASVDIIKKRTQSHDLNEDFIAYAKVFTQRKRHQNLRTGDRYKTIVKKLEKYSGGRLRFKSITVSWLQEYAEWMALRKGNSQNTIHSNLRCIRAILYEAIREGRFPQANNPFFVMKLKQPKVERVKLNEKEIMSLLKLKVEEGSVEEIAKDTFLFSIFACGMRYSDVALLKWGNIEGEHIRYRMQKTGQQQTVAVVPQAKKILDRYADGRKKSRKLIFPLLDQRRDLNDEHILDCNISSSNAIINRTLKKIAKAAKINKTISFHTARHSYADFARRMGMDLYSISKSLGHSGLKVTETYLKKLDNEVTDSAVFNLFEGLK